MKTQPIKTPIRAPKFSRVIAEIRTRTGIDEIAAEALEEFLTERCRMIDGYYEEEYYHELDIVRFAAYNDGYDEGFNDGYDVGYDNGHSDNHSAV